MSKPRMPTGLDAAGRVLWRVLLGDYELDAAELVLLETACRQADDVARLEVLLAAGGMIVEGSAGQPRLSQAVTEARQGRLALARLIDSLRLPSADEDAGRTPTSVRAQRAAQARWRARRAAGATDGPA